jgi:photosystem II stability/assembly factor-like uncharacterized protein
MKFSIQAIVSKGVSICLLLLSVSALYAQEASTAPQLENIGPSIMSGRVVDLEVNPEDPTEFYVAYASGGLWHTTDNGTTFNPIFDNTPTQNIGDIAMHWESRTLYVGTGENNSSRSSYAGIGMFKTTSNGASWEHIGLEDSHHIGRIVINPKDPDHVLVGVIGHLYTTNKERGVFMSSDGGKTWENSLFINKNTGIIDLAATEDFNTIYAASWERDRKAWNFEGSGEGSGIYKSEDQGRSWTLLTTEGSGFPTGSGVGRIGLSVFDNQTLYAVHDSQFRRKPSQRKPSKNDALTKEQFKSLSVKEFLSLSDKALNEFLKSNGFQEKYRAQNVKQLVRDGVAKPADIALYLEDANAMLFDTPVIGAEVYRSDDAGKTWNKTHENYIDGLFYSYGYYFAQVRVDPSDVNNIYLAGVPLIQSKDGGKTFQSINKENVHSDHHALWINPNRPGHLINGNDGGVNITYDDGANWTKNNSPSVGQFYAIQIDHQEPYNVYGGLQDNGVWMAPNTASENRNWLASGHNPWTMLLGGDGMQVEVHRKNPSIVFTGFQFGNYYRIESGKRKAITPKHELGEAPYRFNWQTPILLSSHHPDVLYLGSNKLHRSFDLGETWTTLSPDLTKGGRKGNVAYGTLTTISESPLQFGLIYTGSDDGQIHVTKDGGASWQLISDSLTKGRTDDLWVSRVFASNHKKSRVYASLNGYRNDDFAPYLFVSEDYGATWEAIDSGLPMQPINVVLEDPHNEELLFVGNDHGLYAGLHRGKYWIPFNNGMPAVAVHDLKIQPKAKDLVVGTHGRSIYKVNISELEQLDTSILQSSLHLFAPQKIRASSRWGRSWSAFGTPYKPSTSIKWYQEQAGPVRITVDLEGAAAFTTKVQGIKGLQEWSYSLNLDKDSVKSFEKKSKKSLKAASDGTYYLPKGNYILRISNGEAESKQPLIIE